MLMRISKILGAALLAAALTACDDFAFRPAQEPGQLRWTLDRASLTKAEEALPDTNDFILTVRDGSGTILYQGSYGESPQKLDVTEGNYTVSIVSCSFNKPAFSQPQYGDEQAVIVPAGKSVTVKLQCTLLNAGIRLRTGSDFLENYPNGILYVKQGSDKLKYLYRETRVAYVKAGDVSVLLNNDGKEETLFTRKLNPREILSVTISAPAPTGGKSSITVQTDTSKIWQNENFVIGGGSTSADVISAGEAPNYVGRNGIWVSGYIVGGDLTSAGKSVKTTGITKNTHLALADRSTVTEKASCVAVELPSGKVREGLNLVDHPELIGKRVSIKGNLVDSYFGTIGLKGSSDWEMK